MLITQALKGVIMAKRKRSGRKSKKIPALATAGLIAAGFQAYKGYQAGGVTEMAAWTVGTDSEGKFHPDWLLRNVMPIAAGALGSAVASKLKVNRYISSVPFFKL